MELHNFNTIFGNSSVVRRLEKDEIEFLNSFFFKNGEFLYYPSTIVKQIPQSILTAYCHHHGIYGFPTTELIDFLKQEIGDSLAIEIGAGKGILGRGLGIKQTDSKQQLNKKVIMIYAAMRQPTINYPEYVYTLEANEAINRLKPEVVIGSWITHKWKPGMDRGNKGGVAEERIINKVKKYIVIGHEKIHYDKPILKMDHRIVRPDWLMSRSLDTQGNTIYIWDQEMKWLGLNE